MDKKLTKAELKQLSAQLRCPSGKHATNVGLGMNERNTIISRAAIDSLSWQDGDRVLEIGPGNGAFVHYIFSKAYDLRYQGVDTSEEMVQEATALNNILVATGNAGFIVSNSNDLPFESNSFNKVISVNTIYFWENPHRDLSEIRRVLKKSGVFSLAFASREFMKTLPFTEYGFSLYDKTEVELMLMKSGFSLLTSRWETYAGKGATSDGLIEKDMILITAEK